MASFKKYFYSTHLVRLMAVLMAFSGFSGWAMAQQASTVRRDQPPVVRGPAVPTMPQAVMPAPIQPGVPAANNPRQRQFQDAMREFNSMVDTLTTEMGDIGKRMGDITRQGPEHWRGVIESQRDKIAEFGKRLEEGADIHASMESFDAYLIQEMNSLNAGRHTLRPDQTEALLKRYATMQAEVKNARDAVHNGSRMARSMLQELFATERFISELMKVEAAEAVVRELGAFVKRLEHELNSFRDRMRQTTGIIAGS